MKDYLTHAERLRRIRTERKVQPNNAPGEMQPGNAHVTPETDAVTKLLRTLRKKGKRK